MGDPFIAAVEYDLLECWLSAEQQAPAAPAARPLFDTASHHSLPRHLVCGGQANPRSPAGTSLLPSFPHSRAHSGQTCRGEAVRHVRGRRSPSDRKSTRLNSSHVEIYTLSLHDALPISGGHFSPAQLPTLPRAFRANMPR